MQNFIVLGIIPGTDIQVSFYGWLAIAAGVALVYMLLVQVLRHGRKLKQLPQTINTNTALIGPIIEQQQLFEITI